MSRRRKAQIRKAMLNQSFAGAAARRSQWACAAARRCGRLSASPDIPLDVQGVKMDRRRQSRPPTDEARR